MPSFRPPEWAAQPCRMATLEIWTGGKRMESNDIDGKAYYTFGRDTSACDFELNHASCSRVHAAMVHHEDGRLFLIDLSSSQGTKVDGRSISANKPVHLKNGASVTFGSVESKYIISCESAGEKRRNDDGDEDGMGSGSGKRQLRSVRASHLLVKHRDSRRPASWKEPDGCTRSKEEAIAMVQAFREQVVSGGSQDAAALLQRFAELASKESHCSSAKRGGDLGEFGPGKMQPAFEKATFALEVGQVSEPVVSDSGVHIILRTG